ncbi:MAG: acyl-CoA dehydrogenase C-terminal domain-containing protein, partial [Egicoccus sp.]
AHAALESGDTGAFDADFLQAKLITTKFFAEQVLPTVRGLAPSVTAGAEDLFALTPKQLAG